MPKDIKEKKNNKEAYLKYQCTVLPTSKKYEKASEAIEEKGQQATDSASDQVQAQDWDSSTYDEADWSGNTDGVQSDSWTDGTSPVASLIKDMVQLLDYIQ